MVSPLSAFDRFVIVSVKDADFDVSQTRFFTTSDYPLQTHTPLGDERAVKYFYVFSDKLSTPIICAWLNSQWLSVHGLIESNPGPPTDCKSPYEARGIKILHVNGQSIDNSNKILKIKTFLNQMHGPTILAITESWLKDSEASSTATVIPGYELHRFDTPRPRSRSIAVYVPNQIELSKTSSKHDINSNRVWIQFTYKGMKISLGIIYRRPSATTKFFDKLQVEAAKHLSPDSHSILVGDFNIDVSVDSTDVLQTHLINALSGLDLNQIVHAPTRIGKYTCKETGHVRFTQKTIDHVYINPKLTDLEIEHININAHIGDHSLVGIVVIEKASVPSKHTHTSIIIPNIKKVSPYELDWRLSEEKWTEVYTSATCDEMAEKFHKTLIDNMYLCAPPGKILTCGCTKNPPGASKPWYNNQLLHKRKELDTFYASYALDPQNEIDEWIYKKARNDYFALLDDKEQQFYALKYEKAERDTREIWRVNNEVMGRSKPAPTPIEVIEDEQGGCITDTKQISNAFNQHFAEVGLEFSRSAKSQLDPRIMSPSQIDALISPTF